VSTPPAVLHIVPGPLIARGREASIHEVDGARVLRRYDDARDVTAEVAVMQHVARHGFPVPRVHGVHLGAEGRPTGMVLERLRGPSLIEAALDGALGPAGIGQTLARLHADLHRVPVEGLSPLAGEGQIQPGDVVVHLDLHPANVMLADGAPVVIDWAIARTAPATLDTAMTALTLAAAAVAGIPRDAGDVARLPVPAPLIRAVLDAYLAALTTPPAASLERAAAVLDLIGAQPPEVVRAALGMVRSSLAKDDTGPGRSRES